MTRRKSSRKRPHRATLLAVLGLSFLCSGPLSALDFGAMEGGSGHKFVPLTCLTTEQGLSLLKRLDLGTASAMPGTSALLVTAGAETLAKAVAVLEVADCAEPYDVRRLPTASVPSEERIRALEAAMGNLCLGTFARRPAPGSKPRALVDMHNGAVVIVAPAGRLAELALAVELGPDALTRRSENVITPVQTSAMFESNFNALDSSPRRDMRKRVEEIRLQPVETDVLSGQMTRTPISAGSSLPVPPAPAAFVQAGEESAVATEPDPNVPVLEEAGVLRPGQVVPAGEGELVPADVMAAGAEAQVVPNVGSYEPNVLRNGDRVVDLDLPETLPVIQLLDLVGKYMNLTYLYDPSQVAGEVTLKLNGDFRGTMKVKDLYLLLESVLKFRGLTMSRHKDNVITIGPVSEALNYDPRLVGPGEMALLPGDVVVTKVFDLRYIDAASAKNLLDSMRLSIDVTPIAERGTLIVTAYAYRMERIDQLLRMVDKPGDPRQFKYRQLRYTMARAMAEKVKALAEQLESVSVTVGVPEADPASLMQRMEGESATDYARRVAQLRASATVSAAARRTTAASGEAPTKPGVYLDADERTNRILMIGLDEQLEVVDGLIDALDVEQQDLRTLKLYRLEFVDAAEASNKLAELGVISRPAQTGNSSRITNTGTPSAANPAAAAQAARLAAAQAAAGVTTAAEFSEEGPVEQPQVVVIESTNSLLVNATAEQHAQIETIISYVDAQMLATEIPYRIYPLENSSPDHLAAILQGLIEETTQNQDPEGKIQTTVIGRREEIKIVPDPNTYSLIVYANKKNQDWISDLVTQLDKRRPQVLIDVTLVEITKTDLFNYDLNIIESFPDLAATSGLTGAIAGNITSDTILDRLAQSGRSQFGDAQWNGDQFTAFYGDKHINALLTAMQSKNYGRVLAKPKILVNDNGLGVIQTTDTTYVKKTSSIPVSSGGAGQDATLIETAIDYQDYTAGLTLNIRPHISEGDLLRLGVELTRSDFKATEDTDKPPDQSESTITTDVTVPDGSTIILGGLIRLNQNKGTKKVPLLGDLPLIGGLFRGANNSDNQSKLYVFVKAEVIRPDQSLAHGREQLERISERNRVAFEGHEAKFQDYQTWPGIKPTPLDPPKVLDAQ